MLPTRVVIPSGANTPVLVAKIPVDACMLTVTCIVLPLLLLKTLLGLPPSLPLWGFLRYHAVHDPLFVRVLVGHIRLKSYYFHG